MEIKTSDFFLGERNFHIFQLRLSNQLLLHFSEQKFELENLFLTLPVEHEQLEKMLFLDSEETQMGVLENFRKFLAKKLALPIFFSFSIEFLREDEVLQFQKLAKDKVLEFFK